MAAKCECRAGATCVFCLWPEDLPTVAEKPCYKKCEQRLDGEGCPCGRAPRKVQPCNGLCEDCNCD